MRRRLLHRIGAEAVAIAAVLASIGLPAPPLAAQPSGSAEAKPAANGLPPLGRVFERTGADCAR